MGEDASVLRQGGYENPVYFPLNFAVNLNVP